MSCEVEDHTVWDIAVSVMICWTKKEILIRQWKASIDLVTMFILNKLYGAPYGSNKMEIRVTQGQPLQPLPHSNLSRAFFLFARLLRVIGNVNRIQTPAIHYNAICVVTSAVAMFSDTLLGLPERKEDFRWIDVKPPSLIDGNKILDWSGAWLVEAIVTEKQPFFQGRAEACHAYFSLLSSYALLPFSAANLGSFVATMLIALSSDEVEITRTLLSSLVPLFPNDVKGAKPIAALLLPFLEHFLLKPHTNDEVRHSALCIVNALYPFGNTFGNLKIHQIPFTDEPWELFEDTIPSDIYPSSPFADFTVASSHTQPPLVPSAFKRPKPTPLQPPPFFRKWLDTKGAGDKDDEAWQEKKQLYSSSRRPSTFAQLSERILSLLLRSLLVESNTANIRRIMWALVCIAHEEFKQPEKEKKEKGKMIVGELLKQLQLPSRLGLDKSEILSGNPEVLDDLLDCFSSLSSLAPVIHREFPQMLQQVLFAVAGFVDIALNGVISKRINFGSVALNEQIISHAFYTLTDWVMVSTDFLITNEGASFIGSLFVLVQQSLNAQNFFPAAPQHPSPSISASSSLSSLSSSPSASSSSSSSSSPPSMMSSIPVTGNANSQSQAATFLADCLLTRFGNFPQPHGSFVSTFAHRTRRSEASAAEFNAIISDFVSQHQSMSTSAFSAIPSRQSVRVQQSLSSAAATPLTHSNSFSVSPIPSSLVRTPASSGPPSPATTPPLPTDQSNAVHSFSTLCSPAPFGPSLLPTFPFVAGGRSVNPFHQQPVPTVKPSDVSQHFIQSDNSLLTLVERPVFSPPEGATPGMQRYSPSSPSVPTHIPASTGAFPAAFPPNSYYGPYTTMFINNPSGNSAWDVHPVYATSFPFDGIANTSQQQADQVSKSSQSIQSTQSALDALTRSFGEQPSSSAPFSFFSDVTTPTASQQPHPHASFAPSFDDPLRTLLSAPVSAADSTAGFVFDDEERLRATDSEREEDNAAALAAVSSGTTPSTLSLIRHPYLSVDRTRFKHIFFPSSYSSLFTLFPLASPLTQSHGAFPQSYSFFTQSRLLLAHLGLITSSRLASDCIQFAPPFRGSVPRPLSAAAVEGSSGGVNTTGLNMLGMTQNSSSLQLPRFRPMQETNQAQRVISRLDDISDRMVHKISVVYVKKNQVDQTSIFKNNLSSIPQHFVDFLHSLGWFVHLPTHRGFMGGLDREGTVGQFSLYYADYANETMFHVPAIMPDSIRKGDDDQLVHKKKHVGNDFVHIVWTDHHQEYRPETIVSHFNFVHIVISPMETPGLYRVRVHQQQNPHKPDQIFRSFGPLQDWSIVPAISLPELVRQTAINANRNVRMSQKGFNRSYPTRETQLKEVSKHLLSEHIATTSAKLFIPSIHPSSSTA